MAVSRMRMFRVSIFSIAICILDPIHGFRAIRLPLTHSKRPHSSGHLNPLTRDVANDPGIGHQLRQSFQDDDYFRFLLGDRKRRSPSDDQQFFPDYYDFLMGDEGRLRGKKKRPDASKKQHDYWDFVIGDTFRKRAATGAEGALQNLLGAADGGGVRWPVHGGAKHIGRMGFGHESEY